MASISPDARGYQRIFFVDKNGKRQCLCLGTMPAQRVESVAVHVDALNAARKAGAAIDLETSRWLVQIGDDLHGKLAAAGLVEPRVCARLGSFIDDYITGRSDIAANTRSNMQQARRRLVEHFTEERELRTITAGDADEWLAGQRAKGYAAATIARTVKRAKQFFLAAVRKKLLTENPFQHLKGSKQVNRERDFFVTQDMAYKIIEACPDAEWRLIIALSRFGGLTCPSEHLGLTWDKVDWERNRFLVHKPKNKGKANERRWVPIFPELRPYLEDAFELAEEGAVHVITRYRETNVNLRTQFERIIQRAGVLQWPKLFQNLRSSRRTELQEEWPSHVLNAWFGQSEQVAHDHYLQVREDHFERAAAGQSRAQSRTHAAESKGTQGKEKQKPRKNRGHAGMEALADAGAYPQGEPNKPPEYRDFPLFAAAASQCPEVTQELAGLPPKVIEAVLRAGLQVVRATGTMDRLGAERRLA